MQLITKAWRVGYKETRDTHDHEYEVHLAKYREGALSKFVNGQNIGFPLLYVVREPIEDIVLYEGKEMNRHTAQYHIDLKAWREGMEEMIAKNPGVKVHIWSDEHGMYWGPGRCGYTSDKSKAGVYVIEDAWNATSHCGLSKRIYFCIIDEN